MDNQILFGLIEKCDSDVKQGGLRCLGNFKKSEVEEPLISIITTVKNGETFFEEALESLRNLKYKNFEHIVIDGGSSDKTLDIIKKNEDYIDYWVSVKDEGIYDGFNLGMKLAQGSNI